jgi:AbrB family looped-hinge helix DNA binding protein
MATATVTSKGQVTIPVEVRKDLGLKTGDKLFFVKRRDGEYALKSKTGSVMELKGLVKWKGKPASIADMDRAVARGIAQRYARSKQVS